MTFPELQQMLEATGFPVAYSHFTETDDSPIPAPPFITYLCTYSDHFFADNQVYKSIDTVHIELYTNKKDLDAEAKLEAILNENEIPFNTIEMYIEIEKLFQKIYEVEVL
jgi:hypothetical protein